MKRTKQLIIRVNECEYQELLKRKSKPRLAEWIRDVCLDKPIRDSWIKIINDQYQLSDPYFPSKKQLTKINLNQSISHSSIKKQINELILKGIQQNLINSRDDIFSLLKDSQFEIVRITDNSISIKHELLNKNIRLMGAIYENREFDEEYAKQFAKETTNYRLHNRERIEQASLSIVQQIYEMYYFDL